MKWLAIIVSSCFVLAAQADARQPPAGQAGRGLPPARPAGIDAATARKMVAAAEAAAKVGGNKVAIAVVDVNGDLVIFERMDGATPQAVTSSQGKARAAILFGVPTKEVQDAATNGSPISVTVTMPPPLGGAVELTPFQGGLPLKTNGKVVAAIGVGGAAPADDERFAQAGIDAVK